MLHILFALDALPRCGAILTTTVSWPQECLFTWHFSTCRKWWFAFFLVSMQGFMVEVTKRQLAISYPLLISFPHSLSLSLPYLLLPVSFSESVKWKLSIQTMKSSSSIPSFAMVFFLIIHPVPSFPHSHLFPPANPWEDNSLRLQHTIVLPC